ncbi:MAG: polysaccharide biosynthesis protein [Clostridia bacterium]|nr:polysaccharide biosynthesis protein [Clostridia bacterium]
MSTKNKNKKQTFLEGAAVLLIATALVKVLGACFKIPLNWILEDLAIGYFSTAYNLYLPIYAVALAGMPVAVCRMVSSFVAKEKYSDARQVLKVARMMFLVIGAVGTLAVMLAAQPYLQYIGENAGAYWSILMLAPCLFFCCVMSTYRGYYEGLCNMTPTAISQVIEALGKVVIGLAMVFVVRKLGYGPEVQAAAAMFGIMLGTVFGALYLRLRIWRTGDGFAPEQLTRCGPPSQTRGATFKALAIFAVPVIIGSLVNQAGVLVDTVTIQRRLTDLVQQNPDYFQVNFPEMWAYLTKETTSLVELKAAIPTYFYGSYSGLAFSIYNLVPTITSVLGVSALPIITASYTAGKKEETKTTLEAVYRITSMVAMPAGFGIAALSNGILHLLYSNKPIMADIATPTLTVLGFAVVFGALSLPMTNLLQAVGKERIPVINMFIGTLIKIGLNYWLVGQTRFNIAGGAIGTLACYVFICAADYICLVRYTKIIPNLMAAFVKPLIAASLCGISAWAGYGLISRFLSSQSLSTVISIAIGAVVYLLAVFLLKIITKNDVFMLPKGEKIAKVLEKFHLIG